MTTHGNYHRVFGKTGLSFPPLVFRADVLDDRVQSVPEQTKRIICGEWFQQCEPPIVVSVVMAPDANTCLGALRRHLEHVEPSSGEVHLLLDLRNVALSAVAKSYTAACQLLGDRFRPQLVLVNASTQDESNDDYEPLHDAFSQLAESFAETGLSAIGLRIDSLDSPLLSQMSDDERMSFDFVMLTHSPTVMQHSKEDIQRLAQLEERQIPVIAGGVLHGGFLAGEDSIEGRPINPFGSADQTLINWRKAFTSLCHGHGVRPVHACVQFALSLPGIAAVSLSTWHTDRVAENVLAATTGVPDALWASMREESLLSEDLSHFQ